MKKICLILLTFCCFYTFANTKIRIGVPLFAPPFVSADKTYMAEGFDIDLMNAICIRLQWQCEYLPMKYTSLFSALEEKKIDFAIGGIVIPDKQQAFLFSLPYLVCQGSFILPKKNPAAKVIDLQGKRVGALIGRGYIDYLSQNFIGQFTVVPYPIQADLVADLHDGKIDAAFINYFSALYVEHEYPEQVKLLKEHFEVGDGLGIVSLPGNKALMDQVNHVLLQFQSDGTYVGLYNYHFAFFTRQQQGKN
ncbi:MULTISPECIES: transporter substrate-binding domain-containing protein [unclassified Legionella]|uniref:transporter substrate-binding domain-containing protein n=1 Tax=unclassified Legionella TaxID=2622702 RepID=UPI001056C4A4|nr:MULTISPECIES: transporter substrate-binding domain-containing protein [unclassified Legionella]MDI9818723.1 transporter substrate-binding domain-containing protein [Legionella sp. PL877]